MASITIRQTNTPTMRFNNTLTNRQPHTNSAIHRPTSLIWAVKRLQYILQIILNLTASKPSVDRSKANKLMPPMADTSLLVVNIKSTEGCARCSGQ
tara:strand:+ start:225 stop:512 length:288 start_codon:yes stop_codon:yes gene_type:complete